jgi:hypothetical protein
MLVNTIMSIIYVLTIFYAIKTKDNSKLRPVLIILSFIFIGIFLITLFSQKIVFELSNIFNINTYIFLISLTMYFIIILSIYLMKEFKYIKKNLTKISRKIAINKVYKK